MADTYSQDGRLLAVTTPFGKDVLLLETFEGTEVLSEPFLFHLTMLADATATIAFETILGKAVAAAITPPDGTPRPFSGVVTTFRKGDTVRGLGGDLVRYHAEVRPQLWLLTRHARCRVFERLSVPDILAQVLTGVTTSVKLQGTYPVREYCVQYRESDFAFASRLMEDEGIWYYFEHTAGAHTMVLGDVPVTHPATADPSPVPFRPTADELSGAAVSTWVKSQEVRHAQTVLNDYSFQLPDSDLSATQAGTASAAAGTVTHQLTAGPADQFDDYDHPGSYAHHFDGISSSGAEQAGELNNVFDENRRFAGLRMAADQTPGLVASGAGICPGFCAGFKFTLSGHPDADGDYVLTRVRHQASIAGAYLSVPPTGSEPAYTNAFECLPAAVPFRPARRTPHPLVAGVQTAQVVGPSGNEIFTDKYGRVQVRFFWDRDSTSSCWVRVGTIWAGQQWGVVHVPRVGQEVIVAFEHGDPDRPIIVGSVYNATHMPPYTLPDNMTQSGVKSRSSPQGTADNFNEIRFEDKKGSELVTVQAEKDMTRLVKNDDTLTVQRDQKITVKNDRTEEVTDGNETVTVKAGSRTHSVKTDDSLTVEGKRTITVTGDHTRTVEQGNDAITVSQGNSTLKADAGAVSIEAAQSITLKVGGNTIKVETTGITLTVGGSTVKLEASGVTVQGPVVKTTGQGQVQVQGPVIQVSADGVLQLKGGVTMIG
jgi:type VI secretion system secreted protein VgrG